MVVDWNLVLEIVLKAILAAILPIAIKLLADWVKAKSAEILSGVDDSTRWAIDSAITIAVAAAEQSGLAGLIAKTAEAKKRYAIDAAERYLASMGISFDLDVIADMIEAEVLRQFGHDDKGTKLDFSVDQGAGD